MHLQLKNIAKISLADIELTGITVVAGANDTGKSTVGKVLFCIFNGFCEISNQIYIERTNVIERILDSFYFTTTNRATLRSDTGDMAENILKKRNSYFGDLLLLQADIKEMFLQSDENFEKYLDQESMANVAERVVQILNISDEDIFKTVLQKKLELEFNGQINNIYSAEEKGEIGLKIKNSEVKINVQNHGIVDIVNSFSLNTEVIYMDDPFALDDLNLYRFRKQNNVTHRAHLKAKLMSENSDSSIKEAITEILVTKKLDLIMSKVNMACSGEMIKTKPFMFGYKRDNSDAVLDIKNVSTGLKTFVILKTLLLNGSLEENGTLVLDEPEIHLHPEWQLLFAELIVLIQKEFGMHILLNTHSPYFLSAIEVYAKKYGITQKCKYYLAENIDGGKSVIKEVTDNIELIYKKLAAPLQHLENERYKND